MGELLDRLRAEGSARRGPPCSVGVFLGEHPDVAADLTEALDDRSISNRLIWDEMVLLGYRAGVFQTGRHRRGECSCGRTG